MHLMFSYLIEASGTARRLTISNVSMADAAVWRCDGKDSITTCEIKVKGKKGRVDLV